MKFRQPDYAVLGVFFTPLGSENASEEVPTTLLLQAFHVRDQRLQIIRRKIDGWAAGILLGGGMFEQFGWLVGGEPCYPGALGSAAVPTAPSPWRALHD